MSKFANRQFWIDAADRALTSLAQGILGSSLIGQTGILDVDVVQVLSLGGSFATLSVLTSIAFRGRDEEPPAVQVGRHAA